MNELVPLWQPTSQAIQQTNLSAFIATVNQQYKLNLSSYESLYQWSIQQPVEFWDTVWDFCGVIGDKGENADNASVIDASNIRGASWFPNASLNYAENLLTNQFASHEKAIIFCNEQGEKGYLTQQQLKQDVAQMAQVLRRAGVVKGDRVAAYMPNIPETIIGCLAATSIGAIWTSCSPDFGVSGVIDRFSQVEPKILLSVNGYCYNQKNIDLSPRLEQLADSLPSVEKIIVYDFIEDLSNSINYSHPKIFNWNQLIQEVDANTPLVFEAVEFNHPLFIMFSSGTTGVPKCIVHGTGGTLLQHLKEHQFHTDVKPGEHLFYFTTCGWMMWNWLLSGLASGATLCLYDGAPLIDDGRLLLDYIDDEKITIFGTSAKFIDAINKAGLKPKDTHQLSSLKAILSTGSPLMPESFDYVYEHIKPNVCLSSISGGTDIISCFALGNPMLPVYKGQLQCLGLGMAVAVYDDDGNNLGMGQRGELVCTQAFPSMPIKFWNDADGSKYDKAYFQQFDNHWCHGDYVELTPQGGMIIYGRSDTLLNPGGVRIGTSEIYRQVEQVDEVLESIAIGQRWNGDSRIVLFVVLRESLQLNNDLIAKIKQQIRRNTTPRHVPEIILQVDDIPRTKSGKIVELAVSKKVHDQPINNAEALANPEALALYEHLPELQ